MARKRSNKLVPTPKAAKAPGSSIKKMQNYEDTLEEGGVDDFMFKRDQIMFNPADESDDEDINAEAGEAVLGIDEPEEDEDDYHEEDEEEFDEAPAKKGRKEKVKPDVSGKGRFGKPIESSDEENEEEESGSSDEDDEGWGRQYYSKPSNRREKEDEGVYDEKREEDREMEEREVKRLQRKAREAFGGIEDWGLEDVPASSEGITLSVKEVDEPAPAIAVPETTDPAALIRHMETHEPVKIALAREFPLVVHKLQKTAKGIKDMMAEKDGEESLHKGLGWLHYQTLLTYATTLAFYIHLCALPPSERPDFTTHPILDRLLQLKEGVSMLEDLDFAAGDKSDIDPLEGGEVTEEDEELAELIKNKKELMARMMIASGSGMEVMPDDEDEEDEEGEMYDMDEDMENLWHTAGLEDGELDDLLADATHAPLADDEVELKKKGKKSSKKGDKKQDKEEKLRKKKSKKAKAASDDEEEIDEPASGPSHAFAPLEEPAFVSSKKSKSKSRQNAGDDILGDPTALNDADATDKERRKRSLQFHTSKIASTSARRAAARAQRLGGDEDLPYRDRQAARDAALRKNSQAAVGEDLDGSEFTEKDRKRAREVREEDADDAEGGDDGEDYYDLVKRRKTAKQDAKAAAHEQYQADKFASFEDETHEGGPRSITRTIEKNRGLTPRRAKTGRNPRVKKRQAYEKAKQKVGSQRAVFKGGQAALGGSYQGEKTGISQVVKSRKF